MSTNLGKTRRKKKSAVIARAPDYRKHYATNAVSRLTDSDVRVDFLNEKLPDGDHFIFVSDVGIILTYEAAKILSEQLNSLLRDHEKEAGHIQIRPGRLKVSKAKEVTVVGP